MTVSLRPTSHKSTFHQAVVGCLQALSFSLLNECWSKSPQSSAPIHSLTRYSPSPECQALLWGQLQSWRHYCVLRDTWMTGVGGLSMNTSSQSNRTLGHQPCPNAQGTPHRCVAPPQASSNSLQAWPRAWWLSPFRGLRQLAASTPALTWWPLPGRSFIRLC